MNVPLILVNYKTYSQGIGDAGLKLAKLMEETNKAYAIAPQFTDLKLLASNIKLPVYAQHIDPIQPGSHTGHILAESIESTGAIGTLLNHSEHRIPLKDIEAGIKIADQHGLETIVCVKDVNEAVLAAKLEPDAIAIEPPELIGSGVSVSTTKPELLEDAISKIDSVPLLCGAGITNSGDIKKALEIGMKGVLLASGIVKAQDPARVIEEIATGV
ncbi:triose-phosphate isomerase [archaeon]|nr:triose-phosphate isomerase [archaeon]